MFLTDIQNFKCAQSISRTMCMYKNKNKRVPRAWVTVGISYKKKLDGTALFSLCFMRAPLYVPNVSTHIKCLDTQCRKREKLMDNCLFQNDYLILAFFII